MALQTTPSLSSLLFLERAEQADIIKRAIESGVFLSTKTGRPVKVDSINAFNRYLRQQHGRVQVGQGYYSNAYVGGEGLSTAEYVLKVKRWERSWMSDPWFDTYGPYCYEHKPTNPLFPKVLYVGQPSWAEDQPIALVEKLTFDVNTINGLIERYEAELGGSSIRRIMRDAVALFSGSDNAIIDQKSFRSAFNQLLTELGSNPKDFTEFAHVIVRIANLRDLDMHGNNMGWRDNGELVISDPLS